MSTIASTSSTTGSSNSVLSTNSAQFNQNIFLQLLTTELKNQTPLEPVDNAAFMNQMASYSSVTQQQDLNTNLLKLLDYQGALARVQGLSQGSALLNKTVSYADDSGNTQSGKVASVFVSDSGDVKLRLEDDKEIDLRAVLGISEPAA
ncbi:MAG: flagellar hook assembly protein FlgD [Planctomycetes bacterium]|nr:flagellar hook assembly protein FlgD [Planctomycetota bacterium]MCC7396800.1 flagellar hook assembly protein FlgD [Planctomycetota bacterium]